MKLNRLLPAALLALSLLSGCITQQTPSGGRQTSLLGGAVSVTSDANSAAPAPSGEATASTAPSEKKTSLLWGLINLP